MPSCGGEGAAGFLPYLEAVAAFVGAWRLERFEVTTGDGSVRRPLGSRPGGQISYGHDGHMSAHLVRGDDADGAMPMGEYAGYFGRFSVDAERQVVTHHIAGASRPGMAGTDQLRGFRIEDGLLILSAELSEGRAKLWWRRLGPAAADGCR